MINALITLGDARTYLKPFVDNGTCDESLIDLRVAEAESRLAVKADFKNSLRRLRVLVRNQHFCLPHDVQRILKVAVDGEPAHIFSPLHEFSACGPGDLDMFAPQSLDRHLVDDGEHPVQFDVPIPNATADGWRRQFVDGYRLIAFSTDKDDVAKTLHIRGLGPLNDEIRTDNEPGITLPINRWAHGVEGQIINLATQPMSSQVFRNVTQVVKPLTEQAVTLYAVDPATSAMFLLSKMTPDETVPSYRRYRVTGVDRPSTDAITKLLTFDCACALMLVKMKHMRASRANDILYIQNLPALKLMCMAITHENAGRFNESVAAETRAFQLLLEQKADVEGESTTPMVIDYEPVLTGRNIGRYPR